MNFKKLEWFLFDTNARKQFNQLTFSDLEKQILNIKRSELANWFAWCEKWDNWKRIVDIEGFQGICKNVALRPPPPPPKASTQPQATVNPIKVQTRFKGIEVQTLPQKKKPAQERRQSKRYDMRLKVVITSGNITFRTFSKDLSLSGIRLEHPIPDVMTGKTSTIYISDLNGRENIQFEINFSEANSNIRFAFSNTQKMFVDKLKEWLEAVKTSSSTAKRKAV